jgi:hypothetical protein
VAAEQKLEHADVVSAHAAPDDSCPEQGSAARPQRTPRSRSDEAVDGEAMPPLEDPNCAYRPRALDPVDRPLIEAVVAQGDLDTGDLRVHCARRGGEREGCKCGRVCENQAAHSSGLAVGRQFPSFER